MTILGKIENIDAVRSLEVAVINKNEVVPWQYPSKRAFIYGKWHRDEFENGQIQEPSYDPDLAIVLAQARKNSISLFGPDASNILVPITLTDIRKAIKDSSRAD